MATLVHTIRWAHNTAELTRDLHQGLNQIEAVRASAERTAKSLGGDGLFRAAHNAAAAVQLLGGVSRLTESEKARLNVTLQKAIDKYAALGREAPTALLELAEATRQVEQPTSQLTTRMVAIGTAIGTFVGKLAVDAVKALGREVIDLATNGIKLAPIVTSFERLTASIGESGDAMLNVTRTATKGLVKDLDIMQAANKAILLGLPVTAQEFGMLAGAATTLGRAMGQDATKSLDDLTTALGRSSPQILDNLGLTVKMGEASEAYKRQLNITGRELTDSERKLAFYNAAVAKAKEEMEKLGGVQLTLADQLTRMKVGFTNFTDALGVAIARSPVLNAMLGSLADSMEDAFGSNQVTRVQTLTRVVNDVALTLVDVGQAGIIAAGFLRQAFGPLQGMFASIMSAAFAVGQTFAAITAATAELAAKMPGVGSAFQGVAWAARDTATHIGGMQASFHEQAAEALRATFGNSAFQKSLDAASVSLTQMKARMLEASKVQVSAADIASDLTRNMDTLGTVTEVAGKKAAATAKAYAALMSDVKNAQQLAIRDMDAAFVHSVTSDATKRLQGLVGQAQTPLLPLQNLATAPSRGGLLGLIEAIPLALENMNASLQKSKGILQSWGDTLMSIWKGMSGGKGFRGVLENLGEGLIEGFGNILSGGITSLINMGIGAIGKGIKALFNIGGPSQKELEGRAARADFTDSLRATLTETQRIEAQMNLSRGASLEWAESVIAVRDAYVLTGRTADEGHLAYQRMLDAEKRGAEAVLKVQREIQAVMDEAAADTARLESAIQRYGFTIEELGPKMRAQQLNEQAKELIEDWRVLVGAGIEIVTVNERMAESINGYLQTAIRTGTEVPFAMKPILQTLIDQGKLVDANGELIADLESAGVSFAETMTQGFDRVVLKLEQLIRTLQGAGVEIDNLPAVQVPVQIPDVQQMIQDNLANLGAFNIFGNLPLHQMAAGGAGTVTRPTLFMAGEAGPEDYAFSGANRSFSGGGDNRGLLQAIQTEIAGLRSAMSRELPASIGRSVTDGISRTRLRVT